MYDRRQIKIAFQYISVKAKQENNSCHSTAALALNQSCQLNESYSVKFHEVIGTRKLKGNHIIYSAHTNLNSPAV
jgi:hypothetical protein